MEYALHIRYGTHCTHVRRCVLYRLTPTLGKWPLHALDQHHPSHHGVRPVLVLHNVLSSSPPRGNQEGRGFHSPDSVCLRDANPLTTRVRSYATLAGASLSNGNWAVMGILPIDMKQWDMSNAEHRQMMLGETRVTDVLMPTSWQGHSQPSWEWDGRPPQPRVNVTNPCATPIPEMHVRRMRPTMPFTRHIPPSARPPHHLGVFLTCHLTASM
jgi:hypothetical protein